MILDAYRTRRRDGRTASGPLRRARSAAAWLALLAAGCGGGDQTTGIVRSPVVYGQDGRVELYEEPDELIRTTALAHGLALMDANSVSVAGDGSVHIEPLSAKDQLGLCSDERFADEPAPARCSAVLVRPNLALTAGHCMQDVPCEDMIVVRGFAYDAPDELRPLHTSDLAGCKRMLHREPPRDQDGHLGLDYAWLELNHPFDGPVDLAMAPAASIIEGEATVLVGDGVGVPLKLDGTGKVVDVDPETGHFHASLDNFGGGSGAGVFDTAGALLGIAVTGAHDYDTTSDGCQRTRVLPESSPIESVTYASRAAEGLCAASPRSDVCDASAPSCGMGRKRTDDSLHSLLAVVVSCVSMLWRRRPERSFAGR